MSIEPKGELTQNSVAEKFSVTAADGKNYQTQKITSDFGQGSKTALGERQ